MAIIAGAEGGEDIADFGYDQVDWLREFGEFAHGTPSHHTIARVFAAMEPKHLPPSEWCSHA
ncbi:transposase family protein [Shewanella glacialipiscicola]|uniref:transposase family protein n=1 Tax=Shewanella glacialipiscicola TaxID=614069 RepID=UPI0021D86FF8|nr:transposase family protein [Shewanella glacialipiscicola]MCU7995595.1 transposase family protein [Shewanella glacialipiscicola]MCU8026842.1 transposase family protein [Shewanella glacialipiscicola]